MPQVVPYPAQGHVIPMLELSQWLVKHGIKVTFINTEFNHLRVLESLSDSDNIQELVTMVSVPDGLEPWEDRNDLGKLTEAIFRVIPGELEALIEKVNGKERQKIICVIADWTMGCALEVAEKIGLRRAAFWPAAAAVLPLFFNIPKLVSDGIVDNNGPLLASNRLGKSVGYFWPEDSDCLAWLDKQAANSVIYVAFGSFTVFDQQQFEELGLGLELTNRPFLWVVRQDTMANADKAYPIGFKDRVDNRGRMVGWAWAPQQQVLSHPSVACFISHCGWNSTIEGIGNGVPFLCWPYFADQFLNQTLVPNCSPIGPLLGKSAGHFCPEDSDSLACLYQRPLNSTTCAAFRRLTVFYQTQFPNCWASTYQLPTGHSYGLLCSHTRNMNYMTKVLSFLLLFSHTEELSQILPCVRDLFNSVRGGCSHKNFNNFIDWIMNY